VPGETVLLCREGDGEVFEGSRCRNDNYEEIASTTMVDTQGAFAEVNLEEGTQTLDVTLLLGGAPSHGTPIEVIVDTVAPVLSAWTLTNDDGDGSVDSPGYRDGVLNAVETGGTTSAEVQVDFAGLGGEVDVTIRRLAAAVSEGTTDGVYTFTTADLGPGSHTLTAEISDIHGNELSGAEELIFEIDITPPVVTWVNPTNGAIIILADETWDNGPGAQITGQVRVNGGEVGSDVVITGTTDDPTTLELDGSSRATGQISIAEGSQTLIASGRDAAYNTASATIPVTVDVTGPTIAITAPTEEDLALEDIPIELITTYAEEGRPISLASAFLSGTAGREVGTTVVAATSGEDLSATTELEVTLPGGTQYLTATVTDASGNQTTSAEVQVTVPFTGCGLLFDAPGDSPVHLTTLSQDFSFSVADECVLPTAADVTLRVGCGDETNEECVASCATHPFPRAQCVYTVTVDSEGVAFFDDIPFGDGETVSVEGRTRHPSTDEVSTTESKTIRADATAPQVDSITSPTVLLNIATTEDSADWVLGGDGSIQGPVEFVVSDVDDTTEVTISYNDEVLVSGVSVTANGTTIVNDVVFPSVDEASGATLEILIEDLVGNLDVLDTPLNVDGIPPSVPTLTVDTDSESAVRSARVLHWTASGDDGAAAGAATRYEWVWATSDADLDNDWDELDDPAPVSVASAATVEEPERIDWLALENDFLVGVRAYDEAGNRSAVDDVAISTDLNRTTYTGLSGTFRGLVGLGDVDGDEIDDLLGVSGVSLDLRLYLGETSPGTGSAVTLTPPGPTGTVGNLGAVAAGDINGDGLNDFAVSVSDFGASNSIHIFFGCDEDAPEATCDLETSDVSITLPAFALFDHSAGWGDFVDLGPDGELDDLRFSLGFPFPEMVIIAGREDWSSPPTVSTASESACDSGVFFVTPDAVTTPTFQFGNTSLLADVDGNGSSDLVVGNTHMQFDQAAQVFTFYVIYDRDISDCEATQGVLDLSSAANVDVLVADCATLACGAPSTNASTPHLTFGAAIMDGETVVRPARIAYGLAKMEDVLIYTYDTEASAVGSTYEWLQYPGSDDLDYGFSLSYVDNLDQDENDTTDLIVSTPDPSESLVAEIWLHAGAEGAIEFPTATEVDLVSAFQMGDRVVGGFDFNKDGNPDVAIANGSNGDVVILY